MKRFICLFVFTLCAAGSAPAATVDGAPGLDIPFTAEAAPNDVRFRIVVDDTPVQIRLLPPGKGGRPFAQVELRPDKDGNVLNLSRAGGATKLATVEQSLSFWPKKGSRAMSGIEGVERRTWKGRELRALLRVDQGVACLWVEGQLIMQVEVPPTGFSVRVRSKSGKLSLESETEATAFASSWFPVEMSHLIMPDKKSTVRVVEGIPFEVFGGEAFSLKEAGWPGALKDVGGFTEAYDGGGFFLGDRRVPMMQVRKADYVAAYLLAYAEEEPETTPAVTLRAGRRLQGGGARSQVLIRDFAGTVPYRKDGEGREPYFVVRIPFTEQFAQDIADCNLDIEVTKEVRLARRRPDPNRFRWRPLGKPSSVVIAGMTLEKSPIQMEATPLSRANLVELPAKVGFSVVLSNITADEQRYLLELKVGERSHTANGTLAPGGRAEVTIAIEGGDGLEPGLYPATLSLSGNQRPLLVRRTSIGILPPDTRQYRAEAPWGTWDNHGAHFTPTDTKWTGDLMHKLGLRYGMFNTSFADRERFGVVKGNHFKIVAKAAPDFDFAKAYEDEKAKHPDLSPLVLIFHEDSISGGHVTRLPDLFHDGPSYRLNEEEQARFKTMWETAARGVTEIRARHPETKFQLGNGPVPLREEFYRQKFPAGLFDAGGNENPSFGRIPESQPPDWIANNASLWMDRQLLDAYGYGDKAVGQAHETIYPSTNPGNLSYRTQADYFVRNVLHSMAWKMPAIRPGSLVDAGNSYYHSAWGGVGFLTQYPASAPKPSALAMATLTRVLDGASYEGFLDSGSESAYALCFKRQDGAQVIAVWVVRGEREMSVRLDGASETLKTGGALEATVVAPLGASQKQAFENGVLNVIATASPQWIILPGDAKVASVTLGEPRHPGSDPVGKTTLLDSLESLEGWKVETKRNPMLEYYNPMTPRRLGKFHFEAVREFEGRAGVMVRPGEITHGKPTMPMVQELVRNTPLPLPGKPSEIGLWVNGNSGWGRIIFELEDASGQRWISIGAKAKGGSDWLADWVGKEQAGNYVPGEIADWNTDDAWGLSRINFDGWRYLGFPLPGQYPGEGYPWPASSQWKYDGDGVVHYPLTLKKLIVELPEKTLYLQRYEPVRRPEICLSRLICLEGPVDEPKKAVGDYEEKVQIGIE